MTALVLIPMLGMLALTVDVGYPFGQRRLTEDVADSSPGVAPYTPVTGSLLPVGATQVGATQVGATSRLKIA